MNKVDYKKIICNVNPRFKTLMIYYVLWWLIRHPSPTLHVRVCQSVCVDWIYLLFFLHFSLVHFCHSSKTSHLIFHTIVSLQSGFRGNLMKNSEKNWVSRLNKFSNLSSNYNSVVFILNLINLHNLVLIYSLIGIGYNRYLQAFWFPFMYFEWG